MFDLASIELVLLYMLGDVVWQSSNNRQLPLGPRAVDGGIVGLPPSKDVIRWLEYISTEIHLDKAGAHHYMVIEVELNS
jgi:hypothetical protein